jgi:hypothetical protein
MPDKTPDGTGEDSKESKDSKPEEDKEQGKKVAPKPEDKKSVKDDEEPQDGDDADDDADDDDGDDKLDKDEKLVKISQAKLDAIINKRLAKLQRNLEKKHNGEVKKLEAKIKRSETTAEESRKLVAEQVQKEIDTLPEEVKAMIPAAIDTAEGLKKVQEWLPNAKALASKIDPKLATKTQNSGNPTSPKPAGKEVETAADILKKASSHPLYRRGL